MRADRPDDHDDDVVSEADAALPHHPADQVNWFNRLNHLCR